MNSNYCGRCGRIQCVGGTWCVPNWDKQWIQPPQQIVSYCYKCNNFGTSCVCHNLEILKVNLMNRNISIFTDEEIEAEYNKRKITKVEKQIEELQKELKKLKGEV